MDIIDYYNWRYATKKFNSSKRIASSDLELIKEAVRLAPSSYGLQLFKVLIIEDTSLKKRLLEASFNQHQVVDCSHLFVFCNYTKVLENDIDLFINTKSKLNKSECTCVILRKIDNSKRTAILRLISYLKIDHFR